ncbi:NMT1/THI5 like domain-containing protein [Caldalkalibacillus thermarum TA2.A1]|uniref:NMT1/THI5 like domain-containing protein n=1 Tax=Caldalkalibacillus thermarum (strain TA2.A1) TaxID=986075 RepID=F5L7C7_CALTT|nr:hypothetical protein [Caldalkalibacillus thermarum]EGL82719.1 NMT1/THI5 like domain-containing protein [Caldalkalibacillus thermarum TA2.A1]QZT32579.1 hypothetical protein HUR95_09185 [Caldalkalibacillus thermarum TA2.A1]
MIGAYINQEVPVLEHKGYEYVKAHPKEGLDILFDHQDQANFPLIREVEEHSLAILLSKMETEGEAFGSQTEQNWQETAEWLLEGGLIEEIPPVEEIYVNLDSEK